ncbi:MAG: formylglycine-generating enzyme family protein [Dysgonamonadaceae bacterium]|jgi:formylglycine-generating enzyme required for sulfatase activity|nr:formylglycine-generating enzyme family protein [Dysgonamonadaceae bacterium]
MKTILFTMTALFMLSANSAQAQVTIGSLAEPQSFSILELEGGGARGLRLPQLDSDQRDALDFTGHETEALGLQIFNTDTECVETWNGVEWIQACYNNTPTPVPSPLSAVSCGITNTDATVFTAKADPAAVKYEFYDNGTPQGKQTSNVFDFKTTRTVSEITVKYYYPPAFLKPKMLPVAGSSSWKYGESNTPTTVTIPDLQWSETEITQAQFEAVFTDRGGLAYSAGGNNFACSTNPNYAPSSSKPAEMISWYDAIAYCNKLSAMEGKELCYAVSGVSDWLNLKYTDIPGNSTNNANWDAATCNFTKNGYRLPTSSEWEYAARGGSVRTADYTYSGSSTIGDVAWYWGDIDQTSGNTGYGTHPVGGLKDNELGLYDMSGNVWEWCWNWYDETFPQATPTGSTASTGSSYRVLRGGSWLDDASNCRVSNRGYNYPYSRLNRYGFRVVCR